MARKASMWAKAAGEYYRKNKGKNGIESFTDVLKSSDFKNSYHAKYGKTMGRKANNGRATKRYRGGEEHEPTTPRALPAAPTPPMMGGKATATPAAPTPPMMGGKATLSPAPLIGGRRKRKSGKKTAKRRR